jgi:hypothetical protein
MTVISEPQRSKLYTKVKHLLGAPVRGVEIEDEQLDSLLEFSIGDYSQYVLDWLVESQWTALANLNMDQQSVAKALITRSLDYETQYTYAYSKIVGLQAGGDSILKKDYFDLERNQQIYEIPAGREINELLWFTTAELNNILFDPFSFGFLGGGGPGIGGGAGFAQMGGAGNYFMTPGFDMLMRMQDINLKHRILQGDLTYRITAGPDGKKLVHLYNTPGGRFDFGGMKNRYRVWYWYYEVDGPDRDACLKANPDIVRLPSDVPLDELSWDDLNVPAQQWVRRWFTAYTKEVLGGRIRGKYSGNLKTPDSELVMDYQSLLTESKDEKSKLEEELKQRLERMRPEKMMERAALIAENLNKQLKFRAFPVPIISI